MKKVEKYSAELLCSKIESKLQDYTELPLGQNLVHEEIEFEDLNVDIDMMVVVWPNNQDEFMEVFIESAVGTFLFDDEEMTRAIDTETITIIESLKNF